MSVGEVLKSESFFCHLTEKWSETNKEKFKAIIDGLPKVKELELQGVSK